MAQLLLLEDEPVLCNEMAAFLTRRGHEVLCANCLAAFWPLMAQAEIAILDIMLPDGSGFDAASRLRQSQPHTGIVMLTARGSSEDKLQGLADADHYLVKPVKLIELAAILDALLRRVQRPGWRLDAIERRLVSPAGHEDKLSVQEFILLDCLAQASGGVVSLKEIVAALGEDWLDYDRRRLDTLLSRLRRRWLDATGTALPLRTEHRHGYSFSAPLRRN